MFWFKKGQNQTSINTKRPTVSFMKILIGTSVLNPGAGFLRIFTVAFDRLF